MSHPIFTLIVSFCAAVGTVTAAVKGAADVLALATKLAVWIKSTRDGVAAAPEGLGLRERLLVLLFEATAKRRQGFSDQKLQQILGCTEAELSDAMASLMQNGVARKSLQGDWKYVQSD